LFENLVEISEIPLPFTRLYGPFHEQKLWVGKGVIDPMFLAPGNEFPGIPDRSRSRVGGKSSLSSQETLKPGLS